MAMLYTCPECRGALLENGEHALFCPGCDARFPCRNGVPLLLQNRLALDLRPRLAAALSLEHATPEELDDVFLSSAAYVFTRKGLEHEFANLRGRFGVLDAAIAAAAEENAPSERTGQLPASPQSRLLDTAFRPGETTTRSIRLRNTTKDTVFATEGATPWHLSYHLFDASGRAVVFDGIRTPFPIPLAPGRDITIPLTIEAPPMPGTYRLDVALVQELVA